MVPDERRAAGEKKSTVRAHQQSNLTSARLLIRVEDVSLFAPADVRARGVDAEVRTVMLLEAAHVGH